MWKVKSIKLSILVLIIFSPSYKKSVKEEFMILESDWLEGIDQFSVTVALKLVPAVILPISRNFHNGSTIQETQ